MEKIEEKSRKRGDYMAGRPSKPIDLIVYENKNHITKAEIDARKKAEEALKTKGVINESVEVKRDVIAHKEFLRLKKLYQGIGFIDALDMQIINRYCFGISGLYKLKAMLEKMEQYLNDDMPAEEYSRMCSSMQSMVGKIQQQEKLLLSYEDRMFLNPAGRMRAIPKKPEEKEATGIKAYRERHRHV